MTIFIVGIRMMIFVACVVKKAVAVVPAVVVAVRMVHLVKLEMSSWLVFAPCFLGGLFL